MDHSPPPSSSPPRIAPGDWRAVGPVNTLICRVIAIGAGTAKPPHVFTTLARHRRLFRGWLHFAGGLMPGGKLPRRDTELVILRVAHLCGSAYEWRHHAPLAIRAGLSEEQVEAIRQEDPGASLSDRQQALLNAVDELHSDRALSDATWSELANFLGDTLLIELCLLVGHYEMLAMTLNSLRVEPDPVSLGSTRGPRLRALWARLSLVIVICLAVGLTAATGPARALTLHGGDGLQVLAQHRLDSRLLAATVRTAALPGPANVRILLPAGYGRTRRRYPVLYLMTGTSGAASDWTTEGGAEQITRGLPLIVVMPDIDLGGDGGGWCTNWPDGAYSWETFHIQQLIPWVDFNLRTRHNRQGRAIAGLSQGGFCSTSYAARHPDLFSVTLSYSGAPDISYDQDARTGAMLVINATEVGLDRVPPDSMFGDPVTDEINWAAHDPATLATNLQDTKIFLYVGNGLPGPLDPTPVNPEASFIEGLVSQDTADFHRRLQALHISSLYDPYGNGTHSWPYWARDLRWSIGPLMSDFAHPVPTPRAITFTSADGSYSVYSWQVTMHRLVREFSTLQNASCRGFTLAGSGSGTVRTPPCLRRGRRYRIVLSGHNVRRRMILRAGRGGRLTITVPLGPSNRYQEDTAQAEATGTAVFTTRVQISLMPSRKRSR